MFDKRFYIIQMYVCKIQETSCLFYILKAIKHTVLYNRKQLFSIHHVTKSYSNKYTRQTSVYLTWKYPNWQSHLISVHTSYASHSPAFYEHGGHAKITFCTQTVHEWTLHVCIHNVIMSLCCLLRAHIHTWSCNIMDLSIFWPVVISLWT